MKKNMKGDSNDIIDLILEDHRALKGLIKTLINPAINVKRRRGAFEELSSLLLMHTGPEKQSLYQEMKNHDPLRVQAMEGEAEHSLIEQLTREAKHITNDDLWTAKTKVLAEVLEHHLTEEEQEVLRDYKKLSNAKDRASLGKKYCLLKEELTVEDPMFKVIPKTQVSDPSYIHR